MTANINSTDAINAQNNVPPKDGSKGHMISSSSNVIAALAFIEQYLNSTYDLQAADTQLQSVISNQETTLVQNFEAQENGPGGALTELAAAAAANNQNEITEYSTDYTAQSAENQALTKVMDANSSTAQNTLNQNSQGQQGIVTTMQSLNSIAGNLIHLIQSR